eukprot:1151053-Pelagomonas_calceolata.AAC.1
MAWVVLDGTPWGGRVPSHIMSARHSMTQDSVQAALCNESREDGWVVEVWTGSCVQILDRREKGCIY